MPPEFPHLPLPLVLTDRAKLRGGGQKTEEQKRIEKDRRGHVDKLRRALTGTQNAYFAYRELRREKGYPDFEAGVPLLLRVEEDIDLDFLRSAFNFEVVSQQEDGFVIVSAEDLSFEKLNLALDLFLIEERGGGNAGKLYEIIEDLDLEHRFQRIVDPSLKDRWQEILKLPFIIVDLSIECLGELPDLRDPPAIDASDSEDDRIKKERSYGKSIAIFHTKLHEFYEEWDAKKSKRASEINSLVTHHNGEYIDTFEDSQNDFPDSFVVRVKIPPSGLLDIIYSYPYLFQVSESDPVETTELPEKTGSQQQFEVLPPNRDAPVVCLIDSGVQENHRLIRPAVIHTDSICLLPGKDISDVALYVKGGGHGTRVAGVLLFPNGIPAEDSYQLPCRVINARVLDHENQLPENLTPSRYLITIINKYKKENEVIFFNHSIASKRWAYRKFMSIWATLMDKLSHEEEVLFIQAAGNIHPEIVHRKITNGAEYPEYLMEDEHRIRNPAQSLHALTVGAVSPEEFRDPPFFSVGKKNSPSSYTSAGWGIWNSVKPDVVDIAGDYIYHSDGQQRKIASDLCLDVPRSTLHGGPEHDRTSVGTSFATPRVSALAASIKMILPDASAPLVRALIVHSATIPDSLKDWEHETVLRTVGYGIPDWERALENTEYRITLVSSELQTVKAKQVQIFQIPIPSELRRAGLEDVCRITVTLAYTALPRRTRRTYRFYNSVWVDWCASKQGESYQSFENRMIYSPSGTEKDGLKGFPWFIGEAVDDGAITGIRRQNSSLQKDWAKIPAYNMPSDFCVAVRGHKGWDSDPESVAKYALVVTIESVEKKIPVYVPIQNALIALQEQIQLKSKIRIKI